MSGDLRIERSYRHPPHVLWTALTDRRALTEWLMPNDFRPVIGHRFRFVADPSPGFPGEAGCRVLEMDPAARMVWSWTTGPAEAAGTETTVAWTLVPEGGGTRLVLEHRGLSALGAWQRLLTRRAWRRMLGRLLPRVLGNVSSGGAFTAGAVPLEERAYSARTVPPAFLAGR